MNSEKSVVPMRRGGPVISATGSLQPGCTSRSPGLSVIALLALLLLAPAISLGQANKMFVPFLSRGYKTLFVKNNSSFVNTFYLYNGEAGAGFYDTSAAYGTFNNTNSPPCPLNDQSLGYVRTLWPSSRDLLLKRYIAFPAGTRNVKVRVALDNGIQIYFNGKEVTHGPWNHNSCASALGDTVFTVPDSYLHTGSSTVSTDTLAIHGVWLSSKNYLDLQITGDVPYTITATSSPTGTGTISPTGTVRVMPGANQTFTIPAVKGYHLKNLVVDDTSKGVLLSYTFYNVQANHTISATFDPNIYHLAALATVNGSISPASLDIPYQQSGTFTITSSTGYHVVSLIVDGVSRQVASSTYTPAQTTFTFTGVDTNHTIGAAFVANT